MKLSGRSRQFPHPLSSHKHQPDSIKYSFRLARDPNLSWYHFYLLLTVICVHTTTLQKKFWNMALGKLMNIHELIQLIQNVLFPGPEHLCLISHLCPVHITKESPTALETRAKNHSPEKIMRHTDQQLSVIHFKVRKSNSDHQEPCIRQNCPYQAVGCNTWLSQRKKTHPVILFCLGKNKN